MCAAKRKKVIDQPINIPKYVSAHQSIVYTRPSPVLFVVFIFAHLFFFDKYNKPKENIRKSRPVDIPLEHGRKLMEQISN